MKRIFASGYRLLTSPATASAGLICPPVPPHANINLIILSPYPAFFAGIYLGVPKTQEKTPLRKIIFAYVIGLLIIYIVGLVQFMKVKNLSFYPQEVLLVLETCIIPFLPSDIAKMVIFVPLTYRLRGIISRYLVFDDQQEIFPHE